MMTPKQRVAALLEHLHDSCSLDEIAFYLDNLARWDRNGRLIGLEGYEGKLFDLNRSEEWDRWWEAEGMRRLEDMLSGADEGIPAEKVLAEARARLTK